ncbi:alanine racemase [Cohnella sp.]|uniref:alanine racemase n=1 Tax=Cohnella sp. TaxID=1883426 RepID=UPI00356A2AFF
MNIHPDTPSVIVDTAVMKRNIAAFAKLAELRKVALRPHAKTHKIPEIAQLQLATGAVGVTVAKLSEAEVMADHGIDDLFIAYPIVTDTKVERAIKLGQRVNLMVGVDSLQGALGLSAAAVRHGTTVKVRLEIDTGLGRTGVLYDEAVALACRIVSLPGFKFCGIYTFRGNFMQGKPTLDILRAGVEEGELMVDLAERIRNAGVAVRDVSVGSTPTAASAATVEGVTEIRPGTYVFQDRMQAALGVCRLEDCAATVRVTVVSRPAPDRMIIDGGSKTFATDVLPGVQPLNLQGFGHLREAPHAILERLSEEHGIVRISAFDRFEAGDTLHVIPNHICSTINLHNRIYVQERGTYRSVTVSGRGMVT